MPVGCTLQPWGGRGLGGRCVRVARCCGLGAWTRPLTLGVLIGVLIGLMPGCESLDRRTHGNVSDIIRARQRAALGTPTDLNIEVPDEQPQASAASYEQNPRPNGKDIPVEFRPPDSPDTLVATSAPASQPTARRATVFTLTDALAYALQHRREYQEAKEELYLVALALTLERHLWTPILESEVRTIYGNYGEERDFDQAMRVVSDLGVSQRLPYGGEVTAQAIATLIRDVGNSITAQESGAVELGLNVPLLRGAGHVAREDLLQLERELTYAVRTFERFRRRQLVLVAQDYFDLLRVKQQVTDSEQSLDRARSDYTRALEMEQLRTGDPLDTLRAKQRMLSAENTLHDRREAFRARADQFKLAVGMPVDEPLGRDDLEDIETIEQQVRVGRYPLLLPPLAVDDEELAVSVALERRFELLTARDRVDDSHRGVAISRNAMLPELEWNSSVALDSDPAHYNVSDVRGDRANWRTELILSLPLERAAERNALRRSLISVRSAQRALQDQTERIRADVRSAVNQLRLQEISVDLQRQNLLVAERRAEYAKIKFEDGDISNRDKIEAETELLNAQNLLNLAKTGRWNALLAFHLATETLRVDDDGAQHAAPPGT